MNVNFQNITGENLIDMVIGYVDRSGGKDKVYDGNIALTVNKRECPESFKGNITDEELGVLARYVPADKMKIVFEEYLKFKAGDPEQATDWKYNFDLCKEWAKNYKGADARQASNLITTHFQQAKANRSQ